MVPPNIYEESEEEKSERKKIENIREKLIEKCSRLKINYIAEQTFIPREIISAFKNERRELWEESLIKLNAFLDKY